MNTLIHRFVCGAILAATAAGATAADPFPSRPIRIVVSSGAGGLLDVHARLVAQEMAKDLGQPVVVENIPGAGGLVGIRTVKNAPADGYTLLSAANTFAQNPALKKDPGYDVSKDFTGIGMVSASPMLLVGAPSQPDKTLAELIARAKANPDTLTFASGGVGTSTHMAGALFLQQAGVKLLHVPYKGNPAAMPDLLAGRVNINFDGANTTIPHIKEGRLRAYGVSTAKRSPAFPDIPTLAEQGLPNYNFFVYSSFTVPAATPPEVVQRLAQALRVALNSTPVRERFRLDGSEAGTLSPAELNTYLKEDEQRTIKVVQEMGIPKE